MDKVFSACFDLLNVVKNYLRNIGSVLHHATKHGKALHIHIKVNVQRFYHQRLVIKLWKKWTKIDFFFFEAPCGVNCFALCVKLVNKRRPPENLCFFNMIKNFSLQSQNKSLMLKWITCIANEVKWLGPFIWSWTFCCQLQLYSLFLNPARDLLHISMGNSALNNSTD